MGLKVAGFVAGGTRIDRVEAVDVSYTGFFQQMVDWMAGSLRGSFSRDRCPLSSVRNERSSLITIEWKLHRHPNGPWRIDEQEV
jgi:hypothetical protein